MSKVKNTTVALSQLTPEEQKLTELSHQYRVMEQNKKRYVDEQQSELRRQRGIVDRLAKENAALRERIADQSYLAETALNQHQTATIEAEKKKSELDTQLTQEREAIKQLESKISNTQTTINQMRRQRATAEQARPTAKSVEHKIEQLENALYLTTTKYNGLITDNSKLRESITHLRREHLKFEEQHQKMLMEQEKMQTQMKEEMEEARKNFKDREDLQKQIQQLQEQSLKEEQKFKEDMAELEKAMEKDLKKRHLHLQQLEQQRQQQNEHVIQRQLKQQEDLNSTARLQTEIYTEEHYQKAFLQIVNENIYPEATRLFNENNNELNEEIINQIVQKYTENEDQNFSLFNYANDLRAEVEKKEEELYKLREELNQAKKKKEQTESGLKNEQEILKMNMVQIEKEAEKYQRECDEMEKNMVGVFTQIEKLYQASGLDKVNVNKENVLMVLSEVEGVVDQKVNKLLQLIKKKKIGADMIAKYLFKEEGKQSVKSLAPAAAAIITELNKEDL
ncbi:Outer_dynein arm-docking complex subunit 2 [Hexamita inflata]|uniref:Outer dynein arm-docking complex subunit 2 n=1 Tax=Hexamita inflata TaxID=28002 RepID=A0AA86PI40_9EUKA|nr:Outer dynein arm-docking complex subunit 2 [Hexamita inflata]CAI9944523.1 Outer dynein arm-docking complex subunit 2 [Hexamita inflata]CAI9949048.1 Outer dynein arm-docking complex subunit 2 [Hexamita inflata]CAI9969110.1 Outer dynein arm-docking complex subunit 2 [Hexamita inflata]